MTETYDLFQQGRAHLRAGEPRKRRSRWKRRSGASRTRARSARRSAIAYFRLGRWEEAEAEFRALVELAPADEFAHYGLARALVNQGKRKEATPHFKLARSLRPRPGLEEERTGP